MRLNRLPQAFGCKAEILAKLESFNPTASVKDRIAGAMVEAAERDGTIEPGRTVLVEPPVATRVSRWPWWLPPVAIGSSRCPTR